MDPGDADREELENRVAELEQTVSKMLPDRRGVLKGLGAAAVGGAAVSGATGGASGQSAAGQVGTESEPVDVEGAQGNFDSVSTETLNNTTEVIGAGGHDTLADAHASLPSSGGTLLLAETVTETDDVDITKRVRIVGQGNPFDRDAPAYVDLDGHTLHFIENGHDVNCLQVQNGSVIIGESGVFGGRQDIDIAVVNGNGDGITLRGGHLDCEYVLKAHDCTGNGIVWDFDGDAGPDIDYFNQNVCQVTAHSNDGDGLVMESVNSSTEIYGNQFINFQSELNGSSPWVVNGLILLSNNRFEGYGFEANGSGLDVSPNSGDRTGNVLHVERLSGGGTLEIGGDIIAREAEVRDINTDSESRLMVNGSVIAGTEGEKQRTSSFRTENNGQFINYAQLTEVSDTAINISTADGPAFVVVEGVDQSDSTVNFVDLVLANAFDGATSVESRERGSVATRTYTVDGSSLELAMGSGTYDVSARSFTQA